MPAARRSPEWGVAIAQKACSWHIWRRMPPPAPRSSMIGARIASRSMRWWRSIFGG